MKAIIMAGGKGTRLQPITCRSPKPLTRFFGSTVMGHIIALLKANGVTEICAAVGHMAQEIEDHFGDSIIYRREFSPLGTAGGVKLCGDFYGSEDFIVISGDAVCDFDLSPAIQMHRGNSAAATIVTCRKRDPRAFGLVLTDGSGRVRRFCEKPEWEQVFTDCVNTGIYIISPRAMELVPAGENFDFSKDLFPLLLQCGETLCACSLEGYWCDVGTPEEFLRCTKDVLHGRVKLPGLKNASFSPNIPSVTVIPPCFVAPGVSVGKNSVIGPETVLETDTFLGENSSVSGSVLMGVGAGDNFSAHGCVIAPGTVFENNCSVGHGAVIGPEARFGPGSRVARDAKVWAGGGLAGGETLRREIMAPETAMTLGFGAAKLGKTAGFCFTPGGQTALLAELAAWGARWAGCSTKLAPAVHTPHARFAAERMECDTVVFFEELGDELRLTAMDKHGLPLGEKAMETLTKTGRADPSEQMGTGCVLGSMEQLYTRLSRNYFCPGLNLHVGGSSAAADAAKDFLTACGAILARDEEGVCCFFIGDRGEIAQIKDEQGRRYSTAEIWALLLERLALSGRRTLAMPQSVPWAATQCAKNHGAKVLSLGRDPGAESTFLSCRELRDGIMAAAFLADCMYRENEPMSRLAASLPGISTVSRTVPLHNGPGGVMEKLAELEHTPADRGIYMSVEDGSVRILPGKKGHELRIFAQAASMEAAVELCDTWTLKAKELDSER